MTVEKVPSELGTDFTGAVPADVYVAAQGPTSGPGRIKADSMGGGGGGPPLSNTTPLGPSTSGAAGSSTDAPRADHRHPFQTATDTSITAIPNIAATNVQTALTELELEKQALTARAAANGYASLDASTKVPVAQIPTIQATGVNVAATGAVPSGTLQATVASLDSRIAALSQSLTLGGTYNAASDSVSPIAGQGFVAGPLPAAGPGNANKYLIVSTGGTGTGNAAPMGSIASGNWVYSNGTSWNELEISSGAVAAANVVVTPAGTISSTTVQAALEELDNEKAIATRLITTTNSLTGGGNLGVDRTLALVGDVATPGSNKVYGTDAAGNRGWKADPTGGTANKPIWKIDSASAPLVNPATRIYFPGVAANGVNYPVYQFSGTAEQAVDLFGTVPGTYGLGVIDITFGFATVLTTGTVIWDLAFCPLVSTFAMNAAFTFTTKTVTVTPASTALAYASVALTMTRAEARSLSPNNPFVLRVRRVAVTDTNNDLAYLAHWSMQIVEQ